MTSVSNPTQVQTLVDKLRAQKGITTTQTTVEGANHFFTEHQDVLLDECTTYLEKRLGWIEGGIEETMLLR